MYKESNQCRDLENSSSLTLKYLNMCLTHDFSLPQMSIQNTSPLSLFFIFPEHLCTYFKYSRLIAWFSPCSSYLDLIRPEHHVSFSRHISHLFLKFFNNIFFWIGFFNTGTFFPNPNSLLLNTCLRRHLCHMLFDHAHAITYTFHAAFWCVNINCLECKIYRCSCYEWVPSNTNNWWQYLCNSHNKASIVITSFFNFHIYHLFPNYFFFIVVYI